MATQLNGLPSLSYKGVQAATPPNVVTANRPPTANDVKGFYTGDIWLVKETLQVWMLVPYQTPPLPSRTETWTLLNGNDTGATTFITDGGTASVSAGEIEIVGGPNITTYGATDIVTVSLNGSIVWNATTADLSNGVITIGASHFMHAYGTSNTFVGGQSGNFTLTTGSAIGNTGVGAQTLSELTTGTHNVAVGLAALNDVTTGSRNTAVGVGSQTLVTGGESNTSVGFDSLSNLTVGTYNIAIGRDAGSAYILNESSNILIGNEGVATETNVIRIGTQGGADGQQNACYIAGVYQASTGATKEVMIVDDMGLIGSLAQLPVSLGGTGASTFNTDGVIYFDGTDLASTAPGTAGYVLTSQGGAGMPPVWAAAGGGGGLTTVHTDGADATVAANAITIAGTANEITTSGAGSTVTLGLPTDVSVAGTITAGTGLTVTSGGITSTGTTTLNSLGLGVLQSSAAGVISSSDGTDGQILIASSTGGQAPVWANITPGAGISVINGNGTITIAAAGGGGTGILGINADDSNTALPDGFNTINVFGLAGANITTTATVANTLDIALTGTTNHAVQVGNATGSLTSLGLGTAGQALVSGGAGADPSFGTLGIAGGGTGGTSFTNHAVILGQGSSALAASNVGTDGQVLIAATGADPAFATLVSGDGSITFTLGANSIDMRSVGGGGGGASTFHTDSGDAIVAANAITIHGGLNIGTTGSGSTVTVNLDTSVLQPLTTADGNSGVYALGVTDYTTDRFLHGYGTRNTFAGRQAGNLTLTTGSAVDNSGYGYQVLDALTTGTRNNGFGSGALTSVTTGSNNNAFGVNALATLTTGNRNSAFGELALNSSSTGSDNSAFGKSSMQQMGSGTKNSAFGVNSGLDISSGTLNSAFGYNAMSSVTTGDHNSAFGAESLVSVTTGSDSSAFGYYSLHDLTSGTHNSAFGYFALTNATTGGDNSAFGYQALDSLTTGTQNTAIGSGAGGGVTSATGNTMLGYNAGTTVTSGGSNVIIGNSAGSSLSTTSHSNILIKSAGVAGDVNTMRLGTDGSGTGQINNKTYIAGIYGQTGLSSTRPVVIDSNGQLGTSPGGTTPSFLGVQTGNINNVTGDGTLWYVGSSPASSQAFAILSSTFNIGGGTFYLGDGFTNEAYYQVPSTGVYLFGVTVSAFVTAPSDPPATLSIVTTSRTYTLTTGVFTFTPTIRQGSVFQTLAYMTSGDTVRWRFGTTIPAGTKTVGIDGGVGPVYTEVWGFKIV